METLRFFLTTTFYPPYHIGGDAVHVEYLAEELAKLGHEVHVFHSLDAYRLKRKNPSKEVKRGAVNTHPIKTPFKSSSYLSYVAGGSVAINSKFNSLINEIKPDVVHHHNISLLGYKILRKRDGYINLYTAHDYWLVCQQNNLLKNGFAECKSSSCLLCSLRCAKPPQIWRYGGEFEEAVNEIDCLIAPSDYLKNRFITKMRLKVVTIPNFVPRPPSNIAKSGFFNFFLYAGVLEKTKGILSLVNLFTKYALEAKLIIVGCGSLDNKIRETVKKFNLEDHVLLLGWKNHDVLYRLLNDANALVVPSICPENSPLIILEALSLGTPVIASNSGGIPEIIEKIDKKLVFNDFERLRDILLGFSRKVFPMKAIKHVYELNFSPESYMKKYFEIIQNI